MDFLGIQGVLDFIPPGVSSGIFPEFASVTSADSSGMLSDISQKNPPGVYY